MPDSVIHDEAMVLERVRRLLREGIVMTYDGQAAADAPAQHPGPWRHAGAVALARAVRREIEAAGGRVVPVSRLMALIGLTHVCPIIHKTALCDRFQVPQTYGLTTTPLPEKFRQSGVFGDRVCCGEDVQFCALTIWTGRWLYSTA